VTLSEPDVALTDFALAVECAVLGAWLNWGAAAGDALRKWWTLFFWALGGGALLGGISHGLVTDYESLPARALWSATLLAIGLVALACWAIGGLLLLSPRAARLLTIAAASLFAAYAAIVVFLSPLFVIAIAHYALAGAFLLTALVVIYRRRRKRHLLAGIVGLVLSYAAAAVQRSEIAMPALNLSHHALYHIIQAVALLPIFWAARVMTREAQCRRADNF
jgi:hypothetical protein